MNYDEIPVGPALDALVHEKVFGKKMTEYPEHDWKKTRTGERDDYALDIDDHNGPSCVRCEYGFCVHCKSEPDEPCVVDEPLDYSRSLHWTWKVVEAMQSRGFKVLMGDNSSMGARPGEQFSCRFYRQPAPGYAARVVGGARAITPQEAICRAALKAVQV